MLSFTEERYIHASAEVVYDTITDFSAYSEWNPWIKQADGIAEPGGWVKVNALMGDPENGQGSQQSYEHLVLAAQRPNYFRWCDVGWFTKLAYGERIRHIEHVGEADSLYKVELKVTGLGAFLAKTFFGKAMQKGLKAEADALKQFAEQQQKHKQDKRAEIPGVFA